MTSTQLSQLRTPSKHKDSGKSNGSFQASGEVNGSRNSTRLEDDYLSRQEKVRIINLQPYQTIWFQFQERADLAVQIGIDYENEKNKYAWFIEQVWESNQLPQQ